ncbi:hypothetical protein GEMRC1_010810 [Eukaryota sp. GEM-RC1]
MQVVMPRHRLNLNHRDIINLYQQGIPIDDAARILGVSRTTLKTRCRSLGISSWNQSSGTPPLSLQHSLPSDIIERRAVSPPERGLLLKSVPFFTWYFYSATS